MATTPTIQDLVLQLSSGAWFDKRAALEGIVELCSKADADSAVALSPAGAIPALVLIAFAALQVLASNSAKARRAIAAAGASAQLLQEMEALGLA
ncbi:hypothetical protein FOA52_003906 [Chlamydomonas sp. UWO 241]|nr:hypothetical protein FOA52_003906 [Chlamydomonas sp. UWO 241]